MFKKMIYKILIVIVFSLPWYLLIKKYQEPRIVQLLPLHELLAMTEEERTKYIHRDICFYKQDIRDIDYNCFVLSYGVTNKGIPLAYDSVFELIKNGTYREQLSKMP